MKIRVTEEIRNGVNTKTYELPQVVENLLVLLVEILKEARDKESR